MGLNEFLSMHSGSKPELMKSKQQGLGVGIAYGILGKGAIQCLYEVTMKAWLRKTAGAVQYRWRETVDDFDRTLEAACNEETEEAVVDLWLEYPESFMRGLGASPEGEVQLSAIRRVKTGGTGLQRHDPMAKIASASNWDQEFADAQKHAADVLQQMGKS